MNTPGFEPVTQWSEVECSTARPSAPRSQNREEFLWWEVLQHFCEFLFETSQNRYLEAKLPWVIKPALANHILPYEKSGLIAMGRRFLILTFASLGIAGHFAAARFKILL